MSDSKSEDAARKKEFHTATRELATEVTNFMVDRLPDLDHEDSYERRKAALIGARALELSFGKWLASLVVLGVIKKKDLSEILDGERLRANISIYINGIEGASNERSEEEENPNVKPLTH